jgi:hypothetical protein
MRNRKGLLFLIKKKQKTLELLGALAPLLPAFPEAEVWLLVFKESNFYPSAYSASGV